MGVQPDEYQIFRDFKRRVLDKAVDEVNTYSDMTITPEISRVGRKVVSIQFGLKEKPPMPRYTTGTNLEDSQDSHEKNLAQHRLLNDLKLTKAVTENLLITYDPAYILEKIDFVFTSEAYLKGQIKDISAYVLTAIKNNYQRVKISPVLIEQKSEGADDKKNIIDAESSKIEALRRDYAKYVYTTFFTHMSLLPKEIFEQLTHDWLTYLSSMNNFNANRIKRMYKESVFQHPSAYTDFMRFIKNYFPHHYPSMLSLNEFKEKHAMADVCA